MRSVHGTFRRARDAESYAACCSEDAVITAPGGIQARGRDGARGFIGMWSAAFPDNDIEIVSEYECGSVLVQEGIFNGTHTGNLSTPDGQVIPPTGRSVKAPYIDVFHVEGDLINRHPLLRPARAARAARGRPEPAAAEAS